MRCSEPRQTLAVETDEERLGFTRIEAALADQHLQRFGQVTGDGYYALLAALAAQEHLRSRLIKMKIAQVDAERLGDTRTGSPEKKRFEFVRRSAASSQGRRGRRGQDRGRDRRPSMHRACAACARRRTGSTGAARRDTERVNDFDTPGFGI